ncbi:hypothetical protein DTO280E4_4330 [Paecilomyces variotii]|nr:hypothetical protein DTO280E4_4330 [Paecilomyces variotii]
MTAAQSPEQEESILGLIGDEVFDGKSKKIPSISLRKNPLRTSICPSSLSAASLGTQPMRPCGRDLRSMERSRKPSL